MANTITRYVVCDDDYDWSDGDEYETHAEADEAACRRHACVVAVEYEYADNETVQDYRDDVECPDCRGTGTELGPEGQRTEQGCKRCDGRGEVPPADLTHEERDWRSAQIA